ncbi:MAG: 50S ribosomal protein L19 [Phycisphaeraceae bacterium]
MSDAIIQAVQQAQMKKDLPVISIGDTIDVHVRIIEGSKERIQVFTGVVIKRQGSGLEQTITVRRIVANEGVERTFPIHSPRIAKIEIKRHGHTRRSKLYYLRERVGKKRRLRDRRRGLGWLTDQQEKAEQARAEAEAKEKAAEEAAKAEAATE